MERDSNDLPKLRKKSDTELYVDSLKFSEFDPRQELKDVKNFSSVIFSKRRSGKSILVRDMISKIKDWYTDVYLICETGDSQTELYQFVPKQNIKLTFDEPFLETLFNRQKEKIIKMSSDPNKKVDKTKMPYILIIFDDFISNPRVRTSPIFHKYAVMGRHYNIATVCLSQCVGGRDGIPKGVRGNQDLIICFMLESEVDREGIAMQFLSLNNKKEGIAILRKITEVPYQAIIIKNFVKSVKYDETIRVYNAKLKIKDFYIKNSEANFYESGYLSNRDLKIKKCFS